LAICLFANAWAFHSATYVLTEEAVQELPTDGSEALVFTIRFIPEIKGKPLEELEGILIKNN